MSVLLSGCNSSATPAPDKQPELPTTVSINTDFNQGQQSWSAGFSDYPQGDEAIFQFVAKIRALPDTANQQGFLLAGNNRSDDLFMFLKTKVTGLAAETRYQLAAEINILTNAAQGCLGIGGAPGESVYFKLGANAIEPKQADYHLNLDIGAQSNSGVDAVVLGNAGSEDANCAGTRFGEKTLTLDNTKAFEFISSTSGQAWIFVGTDSGFEGLSQIYYQSINLRLTPVQ